MLPKELSDCKADTQFCVEAASLAETDREEELLLSNELSEYWAKTQLCVEAVPLAETDSLETQIVPNNKHNIRLELWQNNELRLCEDDYGAEVKH